MLKALKSFRAEGLGCKAGVFQGEGLASFDLLSLHSPWRQNLLTMPVFASSVHLKPSKAGKIMTQYLCNQACTMGQMVENQASKIVVLCMNLCFAFNNRAPNKHISKNKDRDIPYKGLRLKSA